MTRLRLPSSVLTSVAGCTPSASLRPSVRSLAPLRPPPPQAHHLLPRRALSSSSSSTPSPPPDPLFYHPLPPSNPRQLALSFIDRPPYSTQSHTPIGFLPVVPNVEPSLADFVENDRFREVLHEALAEAIEQGDKRILAEAQGRGEGWINLTGPLLLSVSATPSLCGLNWRLTLSHLAALADDRNPGLPGRVGDADDLLGSFYVQDGKVPFLSSFSSLFPLTHFERSSFSARQ